MTDGPELPSLASVVALLYRADWSRLSLSGQVRGSDDAPSTVILYPGTVRRTQPQFSGTLISGLIPGQASSPAR